MLRESVISNAVRNLFNNSSIAIFVQVKCLFLIKGVDASQMFELKQGCICCTISDEFELVLQELAESFPNVEHLLIETTGIADPASVIRPFFRDNNLQTIYQFNGTICLVDAISFENSPEKEITIKQIVVADLVLVSKSEQLSEIQKEMFKKNLKIINPFAEIELVYLIFDGSLAPFGACPGFLSGGLGARELPKHQDLNSILQKQKSKFNFVSFSNFHINISTQTLTFQQPLTKNNFSKGFRTPSIYTKLKSTALKESFVSKTNPMNLFCRE